VGRGGGGGMGFYVRDDVNFKTLEDLLVFIPKIFESLTTGIDLIINK
jgi:hypothetical protein